VQGNEKFPETYRRLSFATIQSNTPPLDHRTWCIEVGGRDAGAVWVGVGLMRTLLERTIAKSQSGSELKAARVFTSDALPVEDDKSRKDLPRFGLLQLPPAACSIE
jgi:hypothetical protein